MTPRKKSVTIQPEESPNLISGVILQHEAKKTVKKQYNERISSEGSIHQPSSFSSSFHTVTHQNPVKGKIQNR